MTIREDFEQIDDHDLNWMQWRYKLRREGSRICAYFAYIGCFMLTVGMLISIPSELNNYIAGEFSVLLIVYSIGFVVKISEFTYLIFAVNYQRYREAPKAAWNEWFLFVQRHCQFTMSYIIFLLLCWKLKL